MDQPFTLGETGVEICILLLCALAPRALFPHAAPVVLAAKIFVVAALVCATAALGVLVNPVVSGEPIGGGGLWNALLLGYAAPAALCAALASPAGALPRRLAQATSVAAILLAFAYVTLETRRAFQGPRDRVGPADDRLGILRLFGGLAAAWAGSARIRSVASVQRGALGVGLLRHRDDAQSLRLRSGRARRRTEGDLLPGARRRVDRYRPRLSARRLRETANATFLTGAAVGPWDQNRSATLPRPSLCAHRMGVLATTYS